MKKFLLFLAMACVVPFLGQAQEFSVGKAVKASATQETQTQKVANATVNGMSTTAAVSMADQSLLEDALKEEQIRNSKQTFEPSFGLAGKTNHQAYNVRNDKSESSPAMIQMTGTDFYQFTLNAPANATPYGTSYSDFCNGAEYYLGQYYVSTNLGDFLQLDPASGAVTTIATGNAFQSIAYNPADGQMYGLVLGNSPALYLVDVTSGTGTYFHSVNTGNFILGLDIDNTGRFFLIDAGVNGITECDPVSGEILGSLDFGFTVNYGQDLGTDRETNETYWAAFNADAFEAQLYKYDFDNGDFTLIGTFADQASAFATATDSNPNLPAAPTNLTLTKNGDELVVTMTWTNPTTTMGGDPLDNVSLYVKRNGEIIATFENVTLGGNMTYVDDEIPAAGTYAYSVQSFNEEGVGGSVGGSILVGAMCVYHVDMQDSFGDGWNGGAIHITDEGGNLLASCTLASGSSGSADVTIPTGQYVNMVWVQGSYDSEVSFQFYYPWAELLYEASAPSAGLLISWNNTCIPPTCPRPTQFACVGSTDSQASFSWVENGTATAWNIEYGPIGFAHGTGTTLAVTTNPATITGLPSGTSFQAYVQSDCGGGDLSDWSNVAGFQTAVACGPGFTAVNAQIGDGTVQSYQIPFNTFYNYSIVQELYTAEELMNQGAFFGEIHTISFQYIHATAISDLDVKIYMKNVEETTLSNWILDDLTLVYEDMLSLDNSGPDYYQDIQLQTPFVYDGASSVLVYFVYGHNPYFNSNYRFYMHNTDATRTLYAYRDSSPYDPTNPGVSPYTLTQRTNMHFGMCVTEPEYVTVSGTVTSSYTNNPIAGAAVKFQGALGSTVITDANGAYSLDLVQLFDYTVTATAAGFNTYTAIYNAPEAPTATYNFQMNQPAIAVDPTEVVASCYYMQSATVDVTIHNAGTGLLTWNGTCIMDDAEKSVESAAHVAISGQDLYNFTLGDPADAINHPAGFGGSEFMNTSVFANGITYFATSTSGQFGIIDYENGAVDVIKTGNASGGITFNPIDGTLYGMVLGNGTTVYEIDPETGAETAVVTAQNSNFVLGCAMSPEGRMFIIDAEVDGISEMDLETGEFTTIWSGFTVNYGQDMEWDFEDNLLYWAAFNADAFEAQLWQINVEDGTAIQIGSFYDQASCFSIETYSGPSTKWLTIDPKKGEVAAGGDGVFTVTMDGWHADQGVFTGHIELANNTPEGTLYIPVTFTILAPLCDYPTNLTGEIVDYNNVYLSWDDPAGCDAIYIYYGAEREPFVILEPGEEEYLDEALKPGVYSYNVRAHYPDGCVSMSESELTFECVQPYRLVEGHVYSTMDGSDIAGATITFTGTTPWGARTVVATSDEEGMYSVDVFDGTYTVVAVADGFNVYTVNNYTIEPFGPYTLDFPMEQPAVSLSDYEVTITTGYMNQGIHTMTITNNGTGDLTWGVKIETEDKGGKSLESPAHVAISGQDLYNFTLGNPADAINNPAGFGGSEFMNTSVYVDGVTYFATSTSGQFGIIDYENHSVDVIKTGNASGGITYNPADGNLYGMVLGAGTTVYTINPETGAETAVVTAANSNFVLGCAMNSEGRMFIIDAGVNGISEMNMSTGEFTTIWSGFTVNYGQDMEWDFEDDLLYWAAFNADAFEAQLWQINVDEGTATQIGSFYDQASCFSIETVANSWLVADPKSGVVPAGETATFDLIADGWYAEFGTFYADVFFNNNSLTPQIVVPVTFIINPPDCAPVQNLAGSVEDFNDFYITWAAPAENPGDVIAYGIYHGDDKVPFAQVDPSEFEFVIEDNAPGTYYYRVRAIYADGCVSMSDVLLELTAVEAFGTVYGVVTDSFNGQAIVGATVKFGGAFQTVTDENGEFSMDVTQGYYTVRVSADSYKTYVEENVYVDVYENPMDFELTSLYAPVQNLTAVEESGDVILTWDAPATDDKAAKRGNDHPFIAETSTANATLTAAPASTSEAYNVNPSKAEDAMALAAHNMDLGYFTLNAPAGWSSYGVSGSEFMNTAAYYDGMYYFATSTSGQFGTIDPQTGAINVIKSGNASGGIAYNAADGQLYGIVLGSNAVIYTFDPATGTETFVANINAANFMLGFTFDAEGRMFVIDAEVDGISEIDPATGNIIGSMAAGFTVNYGQDMDVDLELNETYWFAYNADVSAAQLYKFNFDEGTMVLVGTGSTQTSCFAIISEAVSAEVTGYMVERDGEEIATVGPTTLTYVDQDVDFGDHTYCVTAIYEEILSAPVCVTVEMGILGDANGDGLVNVGDVSAIVSYIMFQNPQPFYFKNADVNGDGIINVGDVSGTILIIFGGKSTCETGEVKYQIENGVLYMRNASPVSALQIALSEGSDVEIKGFVVNQGMTPDGYMVVAYNFDGTVFEAGVHALFQVNDAEVNYFLASNACGDVVDGRDGAFLGINDNTMAPAYPNPFSTSVTINNNENAEFVVTSMTGQVVYRTATSSNFVWTPENVNSGVYFINVYVDGVKTQTSKVVYQK